MFQQTWPWASLSPIWCIVCKDNSENIGHLFLPCNFLSMQPQLKLIDVCVSNWKNLLILIGLLEVQTSLEVYYHGDNLESEEFQKLL